MKVSFYRPQLVVDFSLGTLRAPWQRSSRQNRQVSLPNGVKNDLSGCPSAQPAARDLSVAYRLNKSVQGWALFGGTRLGLLDEAKRR